MTTITCNQCGSNFTGRTPEAIRWDADHQAKWCVTTVYCETGQEATDGR
jgi:hypothetical protein